MKSSTEPQSTTDHRPPLDVTAAADYLGITVRHVRELVARRSIPYVKVGRLVRFLPEDLDAYLAERKVKCAS